MQDRLFKVTISCCAFGQWLYTTKVYTARQLVDRQNNLLDVEAIESIEEIVE